MDQDQIAAMFREGELRRRQLRREAILKNEAALTQEQLSAADLAAHQAAIKSIKAAAENYEKETSRGYWTRLWRALLNR
jgi:hypothetical protein